MLKDYFKDKTGSSYRYYFSVLDLPRNTHTLTSLNFSCNFPKDFKPALKEIWDKVKEIRENET